MFTKICISHPLPGEVKISRFECIPSARFFRLIRPLPSLVLFKSKPIPLSLMLMKSEVSVFLISSFSLVAWLYLIILFMDSLHMRYRLCLISGGDENV